MEDNRNKIDAQMLKRYHQGLCTPEECEQIEYWLNASTIGDELDYSHIPKNSAKENLSWAALKQQLTKEDEQASVAILHQTTNTDIKRKWTFAAASILLAACFASFAYYLISQSANIKPVNVSVVAKAGQRIKTALPDGTIVMLNAGSTLSYPKPFTGSMRSVFLEGEAWFDVKQDMHRPFILKTPNTITEVLGTQFNLNTFKNNIDEIYVESGQIKFSPAKNKTIGLILSAREGAQSTPLGKIERTATLSASAWKDGKLIFKDATLLEVCDRLSRWYGLNIKLADKNLQNIPYTAEFNNPNINVVLQNIAFVTNTSYTIKGQQIYIK
ncbi:FecR family protein [Olivibacter domesticus]|nr:FecR family protein [Olivibacter domesticus]